MTKQFKPIEINPLVHGYGGCVASDRITVEGYPVRFMYREAPRNDIDSGWTFFSGFEDDEYINNPNNYGVYDVNTIANYATMIRASFLFSILRSAVCLRRRLNRNGSCASLTGRFPTMSSETALTRRKSPCTHPRGNGRQHYLREPPGNLSARSIQLGTAVAPKACCSGCIAFAGRKSGTVASSGQRPC
jgi:hypothetical protein